MLSKLWGYLNRLFGIKSLFIPSPLIKARIHVNGEWKIQTVHVIGWRGFYLTYEAPEGTGFRLLSEEQALDKNHFKSLYAYHSKGSIITWED